MKTFNNHSQPISFWSEFTSSVHKEHLFTAGDHAYFQQCDQQFDLHNMSYKSHQMTQQHIMDTLNQNKYRAPAPLKHIHTQGTLPHHGIYDESVAAKYDLKLMHDAAYAWKAGKGKYWLEFAKKYLNSWIHTYKPSMNPIDETGFDNMVSTYSVIKSQLSVSDQKKAKDYFAKWCWDYIHSAEYALKKDPVNGVSNWQSHRIKLATVMAMALDDQKLMKRAKSLFHHQIERNILPDGSTVDFHKRDAIHYVVYDLQPLVQAALAAKSCGEDWYHWTSNKGTSLSKAIDWLTPYATGEKPHQEFVHSKEPFDHERQDADVNGFNGLFKPEDAGTLYWYLTRINQNFKPIAEKMQAEAPAYIAFAKA